MTEPIYIISDLHLGSEFCRAGEFVSFIDTLPENASLILNGDTVTHWHRNLTDKDIQILDRLRDESRNRKVIWVNGNHDSFFNLQDKGKIEFTDRHIIDGSTAVWHGHDCDWVRTFLSPLISLAYCIYRLRIRFGAKAIPTSAFAKRIPHLYTPYKGLFIRNAVRFAKKNGFRTVICGHVHHAEDRQVKDVRYINTGSWLEAPLSYIRIDNGSISLERINQDDNSNE